jgi:hypothetical protein
MLTQLKTHNKQWIHLTKMIHDVLPTNYHLHRRQPQQHKCPSCDWEKEDRDHIMRCPSTDRERWRADTIVAVQGISLWLTEASELSPDTFPQRFHRLIRQQNQIGW